MISSVTIAAVALAILLGFAVAVTLREGAQRQLSAVPVRRKSRPF